MSTYARTGLAFPSGDGSLFNAVDPHTGSLVNQLDKDIGQLAQAFADGYVSAGPNSATFQTGSGSSVTVSGSWAYDSATSQVSGYVDEIQHSVSATSGLLETLNNFQFNFSVTFDAADPSQSTGDFSQFANLFTGDDNLSGGALGDVLKGFDGNDTIVGNGGGDHIYGGSGNDQLTGGAGRDKLFGGGGHDVLDGGRGNDHLAGGGSSDTFVFHNHFGHDTIADFSASNHEKIDLSHVTAITSFHDLVHHHLHVRAGGFAEIDVGSHNSILLDGITKSMFGAHHDYSVHDFIF